MTSRSDSAKSIASIVSIMFTTILLSFGIGGCGRAAPPPIPTPPPTPPPPAAPPLELTQVVGKAQIGSQCPLGFYAPPTQVPLELWTCPMGLDPVELLEPLTPLILQIDCKKKTMDIRGIDRSSQASTWEIMPDGSFYFKVDGGIAKLKTDGAGHKNCNVPLFANLWGKVDCKARDQAVVDLETVWWLGSQPEGTNPGSSPSPSPSVSVSPGPSPTVSPSPGVSSTPTPAPTGAPAPSSTPGPVRMSIGTSDLVGESCAVPTGCFFHSSTQVNQCL